MDFDDIDGATPNTVIPSVKRTRRYLTEKEVNKLMDAARKHGRHGHRDATMILLAYRHGLRASELVDLQWSQIELDSGRLHVRRAKRGTPSVHPLQGDEIRALRRLRREQEASPFVFETERGGPMTAKAFGNHFERLGRRAGMPFQICATAAASPWPMQGTTHGRCRLGSAIATSSTQSDTPSWHRIGSSSSGSEHTAHHCAQLIGGLVAPAARPFV